MDKNNFNYFLNSEKLAKIINLPLNPSYKKFKLQLTTFIPSTNIIVEHTINKILFQHNLDISFHAQTLNNSNNLKIMFQQVKEQILNQSIKLLPECNHLIIGIIN